MISLWKVMPTSVQSTPSIRNVLMHPAAAKSHTIAMTQFQNATITLLEILNELCLDAKYSRCTSSVCTKLCLPFLKHPSTRNVPIDPTKAKSNRSATTQNLSTTSNPLEPLIL